MGPTELFIGDPPGILGMESQVPAQAAAAAGTLKLGEHGFGLKVRAPSSVCVIIVVLAMDGTLCLWP